MSKKTIVLPCNILKQEPCQKSDGIKSIEIKSTYTSHLPDGDDKPLKIRPMIIS